MTASRAKGATWWKTDWMQATASNHLCIFQGLTLYGFRIQTLDFEAPPRALCNFIVPWSINRAWLSDPQLRSWRGLVGLVGLDPFGSQKKSDNLILIFSSVSQLLLCCLCRTLDLAYHSRDKCQFGMTLTAFLGGHQMLNEIKFPMTLILYQNMSVYIKGNFSSRSFRYSSKTLS